MFSSLWLASASGVWHHATKFPLTVYMHLKCPPKWCSINNPACHMCDYSRHSKMSKLDEMWVLKEKTICNSSEFIDVGCTSNKCTSHHIVIICHKFSCLPHQFCLRSIDRWTVSTTQALTLSTSFSYSMQSPSEPAQQNNLKPPANRKIFEHCTAEIKSLNILGKKCPVLYIVVIPWAHSEATFSQVILKPCAVTWRYTISGHLVQKTGMHYSVKIYDGNLPMTHYNKDAIVWRETNDYQLFIPLQNHAEHHVICSKSTRTSIHVSKETEIWCSRHFILQ